MILAQRCILQKSMPMRFSGDFAKFMSQNVISQYSDHPSVQNGVLLVSEFNRLREHGHSLVDAVREGTIDRLRPVAMTALMAALGLLPAALSHGIGAETTRPFASVIVGGLVTSTVLTLLLLPILYIKFHEEPHAEIPS